MCGDGSSSSLQLATSRNLLFFDRFASLQLTTSRILLFFDRFASLQLTTSRNLLFFDRFASLQLTTSRILLFFDRFTSLCNSRRRGFWFFLPLPHCNSRFRDVVSCSKRGGRRELNTHTYKVHLPRASSFELLYLRCAARTEAHRSASPRQVGASTTALDHTTEDHDLINFHDGT